MNQNKYSVEFTIDIYDTPSDVLKNSLAGLGDNLSLEETEKTSGKGRIIKIHIHANDPHLIFDTCSQFGHLKQVKVEEIEGG